MSDDLSKLTPTDPSSVDPDWKDKRQSILDGVLDDTTQRRRGIGRWVAGIAVAAVVAVAIGGVVQQLRPEPYAAPAPPKSTAVGPELLAASSLLLGKGKEVGLCLGGVAESRPPQCRTIPVTGITWEDVPWAETSEDLVGGMTYRTTWGDATIVGIFDGTSFAATEVFRADDRAAPQPPAAQKDEDLPTLCETPTRGTGSTSTDALIAMAEQLPGYQGLWVDDDQVTFNIAVTVDLEGARSAVREAFGAEFCVGTIEGPTEQELSDARQALDPLTLGPLMPAEGPPADLNDGASIWGTSFGVTGRGNRLNVYVVQDSPELLESIHTLAGPDVRDFTDVTPFFYPVLSSATPEPTAAATSPSPARPYAHGDPVEITGWLTVTDGVMGLCYGGAGIGEGLGRDPIEFTPPDCVEAFLPVTGIPMPEFNNLYGSIVGTFDGSELQATRWYGGSWRTPGSFVPDEYSSHSDYEPRQTVDICDYQPGRGSLTGERVSPDEPSALDAMASALPGYQGMWTEYDENSDAEGLTGPPVIGYRVAVTHGAEAAQQSLLENSASPLCVATVPGPDEATLVAAMERVDAILFPDVPGKATLFDGEGSGVTVDEAGARLEIAILAKTEEVTAAVEEAVGPEVWQWTEIRPRLESVDPAALKAAAEAPVAMPSGPATPLSIMDEDRGRAETVVATDLKDAAGKSASATMAKATFEQFDALWPIDWEGMRKMHSEPARGVQGVPLPAGAEVLVVTLSAPLSKPDIAAVPASDDRGPSQSSGTINLIDAATGELIVHVTLAGGQPEDRLTELPGPREDVALPAGFR